MKKKLTIAVSIFGVLIIVFAVYYFTPKIFGKGVDPLNVDHINVFDGNTGVGFTVDNSEDIQYIIENIQSSGGICYGVVRASSQRSRNIGYIFRSHYFGRNDFRA